MQTRGVMWGVGVGVEMRGRDGGINSASDQYGGLKGGIEF